MSYSYPEIKGFRGVFRQANSYQLPDGALETAENCVITRDGIVSPRRGRYAYYDPGAKTLNNLFKYQDKLIAVYSDQIGYISESGTSPNEVGSANVASGETVAVTSNRVSRAGQANNNLYFTTDNGVKKLEAFDSDVFDSGVPTALDMDGALVSGSNIAEDTQVAYRAVFAREDANENLLLGAPSDVLTLTNAASSGANAARLEISIPSEIDDATLSWKVQLYRSSQSASDSTAPSADYKLVIEQTLTSSEISAGVVFIDDTVDDVLRGAELYTNPNSGEGELQANNRPPKCEDIAIFKNHVLYFNTESRHLITLDVVDPSSLTDSDYVEIDLGATTRRYVARDTGVGNQTVAASSVSGTGTVTITYTSHGFSNGYTVYISNVTGSVPAGEYTISGVTANTFDITSSGNSATALDFQGITDGTNPIFFVDNTSGSISTQLRDTAKHLVKAVNRDSSSLVYGRYTSGTAGTPGQMAFQAKGFGDFFEFRASAATPAAAFSPELPTSFDESVKSSNDDLVNNVLSSKIGEPEAVPLVNAFPAGSRNSEILRAVALRDAVIILKEDGVFRLTGDSVSNFTITALDTTVECVAKSSVKVLNNQVVFLSNQGVCLVTDSSVQVISRDIEDEIQPILGNSNLETETAAFSYESDRLYQLTTLSPNSNSADVTWVYNIINNSWTTSDLLIKQAIVGPSDTLFAILASDGELYKERKKQTKLDFTDQNYSVTVTAVDLDSLGATVTSSSVVPQVGWVIEKSDSINRITAVTSLGGSSYNLSFNTTTNVEALDALQMYSSYKCTIELAPFHAGLVGRMKQFAIFLLHFRDAAVSKLDIAFRGQSFQEAEYTTWSASDPSPDGGGWGLDPWGSFAWGNQDSISLDTGSISNEPVRIYVTREHQRSTYIKPVIEHEQAAEPFKLQALSFAVRPYGERISN